MLLSGEFRSPSFYNFGVKSILVLFKQFCRFLFMFNIEPVRIELLVPFDVLDLVACV